MNVVSEREPELPDEGVGEEKESTGSLSRSSIQPVPRSSISTARSGLEKLRARVEMDLMILRVLVHSIEIWNQVSAKRMN